jgi:Bacteriophage minor capsid protein
VGQPTEGVKNLLEAAGLGVLGAETGWAIRISRTKDKPDTLITLYDAPGKAPEPGLDINEPTVQVIVRGAPNGYRDAYAKCLRIKDELLGLPSTVMPPDNDIWASVTMPRDILSLGYDDNERPIFSLNFDLIIHQGDLSHSYRESTGLGGGSGGGSGSGSGPPALASGGLLAVPAGAVINGHRAVRFDATQAVVHADTTFDALEAIAGISENAASLGSSVNVRYAGALTFSGWSWTAGQPVFCGSNGVLTGSATGPGPIRQVAVAIAAQAIKVDLRPTMMTI